MIKEKPTLYLSPKVKIVEIKARAMLCQSGGTEKFGMSGNSYDDDDWE